MNEMIKESVAILFCYAIKLDDKDCGIEKSLFCRFMGQNFDCDSEEAHQLFEKMIEDEYLNIDTHLSIISNALYTEPYWKMSILKQLNHIIFKSNMKDEDYEFFEKVQQTFFNK